VLNDGVHRLISAALQIHRIGASRHRLRTFFDDCLRKHSCGCGAVAGDVGGLACDLLHHLRAHVLELVFELDLFGDCDAVLRDARRPE
jgi:hypothetical protein